MKFVTILPSQWYRLIYRTVATVEVASRKELSEQQDTRGCTGNILVKGHPP